MRLEVNGNTIVMSQGSFRAEGQKEGNTYSLIGDHEDIEFLFRLYMMGDKYVFHRESWKDGNIYQMDMSYLLRN